MKKHFFICSIVLSGVIASSQTTLNGFDVMPQRFQTKTLVHFDLAQADTVSLHIYNRWRQLIVPVFTNSLIPKGIYHDTLNMTGIPDEFYAVIFKVGSNTYAKNIVKDEKNIVTPQMFHDVQYGFLVDSLYKVYPRPSQKTFDLKTIQNDFVYPIVYNSENGGPVVKTTNPLSQIITIEGSQFMYLNVNATTPTVAEIAKEEGALRLVKYSPEGNTIFVTIKNSAAFVTFLNVVVAVSYYSGSGIFLEAELLTIEGPFKPGTTTKMDLKVDLPKEAAKFQVIINGATSAVVNTKIVKRELIANANLATDLIPAYPVKEYERTIDYVAVGITVICKGKKERVESTSIELSPGQKAVLATADMRTNIIVDIKFKYKDPFFDDLGSSNKIKKMNFTVTLTE